MKKIFLMLGVAAMVVACENGGESGGGGDGPTVDYEKGFEYLASLNVSDAKMLYKKDATSMRSGDSDDSYWKLDLNGNESKLVVTGEDGNDYNIDIETVTKLSDRVIYIEPNAAQVFDLFYEPYTDSNGNTAESPSLQNMDYGSLVDTQTEKMFKCPTELLQYVSSVFGNDPSKYISDNNGNVYVGRPYGTEIYKISVEDYTLESVLPSGVTFSDFDVTSDGYIMYFYEDIYKIKCPTGRIVPIDGLAFFIANDIYSCNDKQIYKWSKEDGNLISSEICSVEPENDYDGFKVYYALENPVNNSVALVDSSSDWHEFNGTICIRTAVNFYYYPSDDKYIYTNKAWYVKESYGFGKIAMSDYEMSMVEINDYDIITYTATAESPNITVTGYQYSDGANFVGSINENDELVVDEVLTGSTLVDLIPLN